jgi:hypothetical protein
VPPAHHFSGTMQGLHITSMDRPQGPILHGSFFPPYFGLQRSPNDDKVEPRDRSGEARFPE